MDINIVALKTVINKNILQYNNNNNNDFMDEEMKKKQH